MSSTGAIMSPLPMSSMVRAPNRQHPTLHETLDLVSRPIAGLVSPEPFDHYGRDKPRWAGTAFSGLTLSERVAPVPSPR
jgi:hypothetical protein